MKIWKNCFDNQRDFQSDKKIKNYKERFEKLEGSENQESWKLKVKKPPGYEV